MVGRPIAEAAERLWVHLRNAGGGVTAKDAAAELGISVVYARKTLRSWASADLARRDGALYLPVSDAPDRPPVVTTAGVVRARLAHMEAAEFAAIREKTGLADRALARLFGFKDGTGRAIAAMAAGLRTIDRRTADRMRLLEKVVDR